MNETTTLTVSAPTVDKAALRRDLERTHAEFRELVGELDAAKWNAKSGNPGWTCGQLAWHIAEGVKFSHGTIESARKGKQTNPPSFLLPLAFKANEFIVRRNSRKATPESVMTDFDDSLKKLLQLLESVRDDEFSITKTNFGTTQTIEGMFRISIDHFAEHAPQVRAAL
jgi:hypothetical protein